MTGSTIGQNEIPMKFNKIIATENNLTPKSVTAVIELLDDGNTIPFIARYRKEATGGLDEVQLRKIETELNRLRSLEERRETILKAVRSQEKLTAELEKEIKAAGTKTELEDLYQPYKKKRKTRASKARGLGLEELAEMILRQDPNSPEPDQAAAEFLSSNVPSVDQALQGARDIAAELISDHPAVRRETRKRALRSSRVSTRKKKGAEDPRGVFKAYYNFQYPVQKLRSHQILALNRAEEKGVLRFGLDIPDQDWQEVLQEKFPSRSESPLAGELQEAGVDAARRLLLPAIERDLRRNLTDKAEDEAIEVFAKNLRSLLLQPPLQDQTVMGLDPGFRTGCKVAVVDPTGKALETATIYPVPPREDIESARKKVMELIEKHKVTLIAVGNGTALRETEQFVSDLIADQPDLAYLIVSEAGASVYSASELAGQELPDMDVSLRGAVSIARRIQDPLAELVKIDPRSIGVGMYQHDVSQAKLTEKLAEVVESVVNQVGVDLNTASPALLTHVAGIGPATARNIVEHRDQKGPFQNRSELLAVPGLGEKTFQQAAGFLRIQDGENFLDSTSIHPESYPAAEKVIELSEIQEQDSIEIRMEKLTHLSQQESADALAQKLKIGKLTLIDIFKQLAAPGRDPREDLPKPILRRDVLTMEDLEVGTVLQGTVRNVVDFGAFIDIGVKQDGLLHRSQIPQGKAVQVGDVISVRVLNVEPERGRIGLSWAEN